MDDLSRRRFVRLLYAAVGTVLGGGAAFNVYRAVRQLIVRTPPSPEPRYVRFSPKEITTVASLGSVGDYQTFPFINRSGVVIRVPIPVSGGLSLGAKHFIAYDQKCTHQGCTVRYHKTHSSSPEVPPTQGPLLICPCHGSVFSAYRAGESVAGPARKALARIELTAKDGVIYATAIELN